MKVLKCLISSILAGLSIGFGGIAYLSVDNKLVGAIFFTIGLFLVCSFGYNLYTGKVCYIFDNDIKYTLNLITIVAGNLIGTFIMGKAILFTRFGADIGKRAESLCNTKLNDTYLSLFILGILCDVMIYIAVEGYSKINYELGKYLALVFGVVVFILGGFEHCIADMFYFSAASMWSVNAAIRVFVILLGNAIGGVLMPLLRRAARQENK